MLVLAHTLHVEGFVTFMYLRRSLWLFRNPLDSLKVVFFYLIYLYNGLQREIVLGWGCKRDR
jgi:hypothetical protein